MEAQRAIVTAITVREYDETKLVEKENILKILDAGRMSPSAKNLQPWYFIVVSDRGRLKRLAEFLPTGRHAAKSSFAVAVVTDPRNPYHEIDGTRAIQSMVIAAWNLGLGSSWVGNIERDRVMELLKIPKELNLLTIIPFGYPTRQYEGKKSRKPLSEIAFSDVFGNSYLTKSNFFAHQSSFPLK